MNSEAPFDLTASCQTKTDKIINLWGWSDFEYKGKIIQVTTLPLVDADTMLFARPTYADSIIYAEQIGAKMMTADLVEEIFLKGYAIKPALQPASSQMGTRKWAVNHDVGVWKQLANWDSITPVANAGKDWVTPAPAGRASNFGWIGEGSYRTPRGLKCWQPLPGTAHDSGIIKTKKNDSGELIKFSIGGHFDYSQCLRLWRD